MRVPGPLMLAGLLAASPVWANHDWVGLDLCRTYPERMPPELDPGVLPEPEGPGARLLGHYCGQCHFAPGPGQHSAGEWARVVPRMDLLMDVTARFGDLLRPIEQPSPEERATLLAYLERYALRPLAAGDESPAAYRALCGDCHAAPDPAAYAGADWPTLLARMDGHRVTMLRPVADARARAQVAAYLSTPLGVPAAAPSAAELTGPAREVAWAHPASDPGSASGRWLALGPVFLLVLLGLGRWALHHRRRWRVRSVWVPVALVLVAIPLGCLYVYWSKSGPGAGLYSRVWSPDPVQGWWDPDRFFQPIQSVQGVFAAGQCIQCHEAITPGIVADWRASRHARLAEREPVACPDCHGADHQRLHLPTPEVCGACHAKQHGDFQDEARYGFPSHVLAMERAVDAKHFADKPKAEVQACVQCHSVATKCDSCHTRHRFDPAEARRPEACITCHSGPPHPDDDTYFASAHGRIVREEGDGWDWSKPLAKGNYKAPSCAYCHMGSGRHQVADKSLWKFGLLEVNPHTSGNRVLRERWVALCVDCHEEGQSRDWLAGLDAERKAAWGKLYAAEDLLKGLRADDLLHPGPSERPPYPMDAPDALWARARIGYYEGQASAFYNVSALERDYFEMWYFDNLGAYKAAAHGDAEGVTRGHAAMDRTLVRIELQAQALRTLGTAERARDGRRSDPGDLWLAGPYTEANSAGN